MIRVSVTLLVLLLTACAAPVIEKPDDRGIEYDTAAQKALDKTLDEINRRYGESKVTHARALRKAQKTKPG